MHPQRSPHAHSTASRFLLSWIDSNELPWTFPLPPWSAPRARALRRLRILARKRLREERISLQGWPRTLTQALAWPLIAGIKAVRSLGHYPPPHGSGTWGRLVEVVFRWWVQAAHNIRLADQAELLVHQPDNRRRLSAFITCRENQALINLSGLRIQGYPNIHLKNPFARFCSEYRLPTPVALITGNGTVITSSRPVPQADLFLKLANAGKGAGAEILRRSPEADGWIGADGVFLNEVDLAPYAARRLGDEEWIFQERLSNDPSWLGYTTGALSTIRVVTARRQPNGQPEFLTAFLRMPRKDSPVDNLSAGGLGATVDLTDGHLGQVFDWVDPWRSLSSHPETGSRITGTLLPGWDRILELALRAHSHAGDWLSIGWDVSLTERGPVLIEANLNWAIPSRPPMIETRYVEIMNSLFFPAE